MRSSRGVLDDKDYETLHSTVLPAGGLGRAVEPNTRSSTKPIHWDRQLRRIRRDAPYGREMDTQRAAISTSPLAGKVGA
jgi:hypothetical protein